MQSTTSDPLGWTSQLVQLSEKLCSKRETFALVHAYLDARRDEIAVADLDMATFICVTTVETLTHEIVIRHPETRDSGQPVFVEEVARLILGYLRPAIPGAPMVQAQPSIYRIDDVPA